MSNITVLNKAPLCVTVEANSEFIDAGFAFAAARRAAAGASSRLLRELVDHKNVTINPHAKQHAATTFQYIDLAEVNEVLGSVMTYREILGSLIGSTKVRFKHRDILFAKIRPSIDNKKVAFVYQEFENAVASTEFLVLRAKEGIDPEYLYAALRSDDITEAVIRECGGDTGRQRIAAGNLLNLPIPWPEQSVREDVVTSVSAYFKSLEASVALRQQALERASEALGATTMRTAKPRRARSRKG